MRAIFFSHNPHGIYTMKDGTPSRGTEVREHRHLLYAFQYSEIVLRV